MVCCGGGRRRGRPRHASRSPCHSGESRGRRGGRRFDRDGALAAGSGRGRGSAPAGRENRHEKAERGASRDSEEDDADRDVPRRRRSISGEQGRAHALRRKSRRRSLQTQREYDAVLDRMQDASGLLAVMQQTSGALIVPGGALGEYYAFSSEL